MVLSQRKLYFTKDPGKVQYFPGGPSFSRGGGGGWGSNAYFHRNS